MKKCRDELTNVGVNEGMGWQMEGCGSEWRTVGLGKCAWLVQKCAHSHARACARHGYKSSLHDRANGIGHSKEM